MKKPNLQSSAQLALFLEPSDTNGNTAVPPPQSGPACNDREGRTEVPEVDPIEATLPNTSASFVKVDSLDLATLAACIPALSRDLAAVERWIAARTDVVADQRAGRPSHTARSYRREATRFLFWLRVERGVCLNDAALEDTAAYRDFVCNPQPYKRWCGRRGLHAGLPGWRPFTGPLSARSCRQVLVILSTMYRFLQDQKYVVGNPLTGLAMPRGSAPQMDTMRSLSRAQWMVVEQELAAYSYATGSLDLTTSVQRFIQRQLAWAVRLLYATGLRLAEVVSLNCDDLEWFDLGSDAKSPGDSQAGPQAGGWIVRVTGKGLKTREVPVPTGLVEELIAMLPARGAASQDSWDLPDRPLLLSRQALIATARGQKREGRLSAQSLHRQVKAMFSKAAVRVRRDGRARDADALARASTHWLRHTCGSHSVADGVPLDVVQQNLGHSSLAVTTRYVQAELGRRVRESARRVLQT